MRGILFFDVAAWRYLFSKTIQQMDHKKNDDKMGIVWAEGKVNGKMIFVESDEDSGAGGF